MGDSTERTRADQECCKIGESEGGKPDVPTVNRQKARGRR